MSRFLVYVLHHVSSDSCYVGKSCSGLNRPKEHGQQWALANSDYAVTRWIKKLRSFGFDYEISVLEVCASADEVKEAEIWYISYFRAVGLKLLNLTDGGDGAVGRILLEGRRRGGWPKGVPRSAETREKIAKSLAGKIRDPEATRKAAESNKGKKRTLEFCARQSGESNPSKRSEVRAKISAAKMGKPNLKARGRVRSEEHRRNLSIAQIGRLRTVPRLRINLIGGAR